jgi:hypothetical protein
MRIFITVIGFIVLVLVNLYFVMVMVNTTVNEDRTPFVELHTDPNKRICIDILHREEDKNK